MSRALARVPVVGGAIVKNFDAFPLFGMILYTARHPHIIKVLRDRDYWNALSHASGPYLGVFVLRPLVPAVDRRRSARGALIKVKSQINATEELLSWFKISVAKLPVFVVFGVDQSGTYHRAVRIDASTVDRSYSSLTEVLSLLHVSIERAGPEGNDRRALYDALQMKLTLLTIKRQASHLLKVIGLLRGASGI